MNRIRFEYDRQTSGTTVSFLLKDSAMSLDIGPKRMQEGREHSTIPWCMDYPANIHNLTVVKNIVEALIKQKEKEDNSLAISVTMRDRGHRTPQEWVNEILTDVLIHLGPGKDDGVEVKVENKS